MSSEEKNSLIFGPIIKKVYNIQGSTAAQGTGEYHRYREYRRRERIFLSKIEKDLKLKDLEEKFLLERKIKKDKLSKITERKKKKRDRRRLSNKIKRCCQNREKIFDENIPLIDQIQNEIKDNLYKENKNENNNMIDIVVEENIKNDYKNLKSNVTSKMSNLNFKENNKKEDQKLNYLIPNKIKEYEEIIIHDDKDFDS